MKLEELLQGLTVIKVNVSLDTEITYIACDHRKVIKNSAFVGIKGTKRNGNDYILSAINNGATVIITDDFTVCKMALPYILVRNARESFSTMWSNFYNNPAKSIKTVAITGTNGKTSSAYFLYNVLRKANIKCGLISTIECIIDGEKIENTGGGSVLDISSAMTTPDPECLFYIYNKMKEKGVEIAVIEASSHALTQGRLFPIDIEIGAFTNLSREHLDFHGDMEEYFLAKEKLFHKCKKGIVNVDDPYGKRLKNKFCHTVGFSVKENTDFYATDVILDNNGCEYVLNYKDEKIKMMSKLIGDFTVYNTLLASGCAKMLGIENEAIQKGIFNTLNIKGRLERYKDKSIYIDYAHTPTAMEKIIKTVKQAEPKKRLYVMFGCGGDRDKGKRAEMGKISTDLADLTVITADNSRTEALENIIADILKGVDKKKTYKIIPNRKDAIKFLAENLENDVVILLLGKGHEEYEIINNEKMRFSEKEILDEVFILDK